MLSVVLLNFVMLNVSLLNVIMVSVVLLSVIMLSVVRLIVVAPFDVQTENINLIPQSLLFPFSSLPCNRGRIRTLNLRTIGQVFYHCATSA
jgi:hypothetical protein